MIRGLHGLLYSTDADAARAFMRDALRLPATDVGGGWLIFDLPEADIGVHPVDSKGGGPPAGTHDLSFYCDDIRGTMADLRKRGVHFTREPADHGYGYVTYFTMPGGIEVQLYEPKYAKKGKRKDAARKREPAAAAKGKRKKATKAKPAPKRAARKRR
jgi:predicted enzyme related to lactoylglutathione lyase